MSSYTPISKALKEADNCDLRAVELADRDDADCIWRVALLHPECIRHVMNKLRSMGYDLDAHRGSAGKQLFKETMAKRCATHGSALT